MNLTPNQQNLLDKLPLITKDSPEFRANPYTGVTHKLEPLAVSLYNFITEAEGIGTPDQLGQYKSVFYNITSVPMSLWHQARYLFNDLWPDEYMDLID